MATYTFMISSPTTPSLLIEPWVLSSSWQCTPFLIQIGIVYFSQSRLLSIKISRWPRRRHTCYFANMRAFLVAWWIRILLPTQGTWVQSLVQEDSACWGATKPANLNYWAHTIRALEPQLPSLSAATSKAHAPESLCSTRQATTMRNPSLQWRVAPIHNNWRKLMQSKEDPVQPKPNNFFFNFKENMRNHF